MRTANTIGALLVGVSLSLSGTFVEKLQAEIVFFDDFEGHSDVATTWVDSNDRDPGSPPIGAGWTAIDGPDENRVQVMQSPVSGGGNHVFDTPYGTQFLHQWRDASDGGEAWAEIGAAGQTAITTNGTLRLSFDFYSVNGIDGWGGNYNVAGFDSGVQIYSGRAFDVSFRANGDVLTYVGGTSLSQPSLAAAYVLNAWNHVVIDADFVADTWSITVNNATVSGLTFGATIDEALNISKIQQVSFAATDASGVAGRSGLDNVLMVTPIPEPSGIMLMALGTIALVSVVRRQKSQL